MATILAQLGSIIASALASVSSALTQSIEAEASSRKADDATNLASAKSYTDQKITDLVNGAPETLDTLKEIADEIENNETALEAITQAVQNHTHPVATTSANGFMAAADKVALNSASTNIETIQEDLTANTATLASHTSTLASHTSTLSSHTSSISNLQDDLSDVTTSYSTLGDAVSDVENRTATLEDDIATLQTNQSADEAILASHTSTLASHTSTLSSHTSTLSSHTSSIASLQTNKLTTSQLYAGSANLITKPGIAEIASTLTSSSYVQPKNTTQGAYAVSWTFTGPSDTYDSSSSASSGVIQFLIKTFTDATTSYYPIVHKAGSGSSGNTNSFLWVSFFVDGWTKSFPPFNLIQLGGISSDSWLWFWDPTNSDFLYKSGYIQVSDSTRRYFLAFSTGSYSSLYLYRTALSCSAGYPNTHNKTVTIYRPMVSIGTCLADWAPSPIDQFC